MELGIASEPRSPAKSADLLWVLVSFASHVEIIASQRKASILMAITNLAGTRPADFPGWASVRNPIWISISSQDFRRTPLWRLRR